MLEKNFEIHNQLLKKVKKGEVKVKNLSFPEDNSLQNEHLQALKLLVK